MSLLRMQGGLPLEGSVRLQRSKNAVLPMLAAAVMARGEVILEDCPALSDVENMLRILRRLGCAARRQGRDIHIAPGDGQIWEIPEELSGLLRSSVFLLGPIIARCGRAEAAYPGGCEIGLRPIDLHLKGLRALGVEIAEEHGRIRCRAERLQGASVALDFPSVGATENVMMAACLAKGTTTICNAAMEPEIEDLAGLLRCMGARIRGAGSPTIEIEGVSELRGARYRPMPDRIAAGTFMAATAAAGGHVRIEGARAQDLRAVIEKFREAGCEVVEEEGAVTIGRTGPLKPFTISTRPYPGFPTDLQSPFLALACLARGTSTVEENLFENRFGAAAQLRRMGAEIALHDRTALIRGGRLTGARVCAGDLRAGAALVAAGLAAEGCSEIEGVERIERGYEHLEEDLAALGAKIRRVD
ncbi:MAG: UDP-N-acetylglucosamine 1-carboxyvinyltransferase [Eubacteriales bacterium]|nr:UDP-N-acetylglucosamine 1-carboxyvinyltransferase [Eubacteriales bacterium]